MPGSPSLPGPGRRVPGTPSLEGRCVPEALPVSDPAWLLLVGPPEPSGSVRGAVFDHEAGRIGQYQSFSLIRQ